MHDLARKDLKLACRYVAVGFLIALLSGCGQESSTPEQQIRERIDALVEAIEARDKLAVAGFVHAAYADARHRDKRSALGSLLGYMLRHRSIHLFTLVRSIEFIDGDQPARATVFVAMTGVPVNSLETLISLKADLYRFDLQWLNDDNWQIRSAAWQRAEPAALLGAQ